MRKAREEREVKSKYFLTLFLIGVLPLLALAGVYYWMAYNEKPAPVPSTSAVNTNALQTTIPILQSQLSTMASTLKAAIEGTYQGVSGLVGNHSDTDLDNFVKSHPGLEGVAVLTMDGKVQKTIPATAQLADPSYGSSEEFQKMISKFKENGGKTDLFYTQRLNYPAFIFSIPLDSRTLVQAVLNLSYFFRDIDPKSGEIFLLDADSGQYFYHSNPAKLQTAFNPNQEGWLNKVQQALVGKQSGSELNPPVSAAIYSYVGIKAFGIVHVVPFLGSSAALAGIDAFQPYRHPTIAGNHPSPHRFYRRRHRRRILGLDTPRRLPWLGNDPQTPAQGQRPGPQRGPRQRRAFPPIGQSLRQR